MVRALVMLLTTLFPAMVCMAQQTQEQEAARLQEEAVKSLDSGKYPAGIELSKRAVALREQASGAEHPDVAASLETLGRLSALAYGQSGELSAEQYRILST